MAIRNRLNHYLIIVLKQKQYSFTKNWKQRREYYKIN
ncbi:Uncharacterised protein [Sphingobacterium multivorum]|uniref:Uncharacterized protein n=1 Tax=Sphingobacterium multivorum TaxID=28454 RepID=A0A2X2JJZ7_SPHMU|nr:Uncharacterised protein [Sphingobacterium multivorum]